MEQRAGHGEDIQVCGVGQQSGSCLYSVHWMIEVGAQPGGMSFTCLQVGEEFIRALLFFQRLWECPDALLKLGLEGEGIKM